MMKRVALFVLLALSSCWAEFAFFPQRSGHILLKQRNQDEILNLAIWNGNVEINKDERNMKETDFVDYLSFTLGTPLTDLSSAHLFKNQDIFETKKANVLMIVEAPQDNTWSILSQTKKVEMTKSFYPQDSVATLTTLMTGHSPSEHGIVAKTWPSSKGGFQSAYHAQALPEVQNFVDLVSRSYGGVPLSVSGSSDFQLASALSASQELHSLQTSSNLNGLFWDGKCFTSIYPSNEKSGFSLCKQEIIERFAQDFQATGHGDVLTVNSVNFDLQSQVDVAFLAEIEFAVHVSRTVVASNSLVADAVPDVFSFAFASLKELAKVNGQTSTKYQVALALTGKVIERVFQQISSAYKGQMTGEILFLTSAPISEQDKSSVYSLIKDDLQDKSVFSQNFPMIYIKDIMKIPYVCETLQAEVSHVFDIYCVSNENPAYFNHNSLLGNTTDAGNTVAGFQIVLWVSIILVITTYAIIYAIMSMDVGGDSLVFRLTNLNTKKTL